MTKSTETTNVMDKGVLQSVINGDYLYLHFLSGPQKMGGRKAYR